MVSNTMLWMLAAGGFSLAAYGQNAPKMVPVPTDPLETVTADTQVANTQASRDAALQLLARARSSYALRSAGQAFDIKVSFTVNSGGQTDYDGAWQMEDVFDAKQGHRWSAHADAGFAITQLAGKQGIFGEGTSSTIPLRLQEARAILFDPIPGTAAVDRQAIRTTDVTFGGSQLTCILLSASGVATAPATGRSWDETEECIDPQSGLLRIHSQVPGRYAVYDYSDGPQFGGRILPRKVTIAEAGKTVSTISVDSWKPLSSADPEFFVPSAEMKAGGRAVGMGPAQKVSILSGDGPFTAETTVRPVCVFGVVAPTGQLVEAHSLQPSDPNSAAAVEAAKRMNFTLPGPAGPPQQRFVFVIEKFAAQ